MKEIRTEDAVGHVLCHDITQIIKDEKKGVLFKKGHIVREEDIPALLSVGKEHLYVWEKQEGILHENEAAEILYRISADIHMHGSDIKEGKIELIADCDGVLKIRRDALLAVNSLGEMMIASRHGDFPVKKGEKAGEIIYFSGQKELGRIPVIYSESIRIRKYTDCLKDTLCTFWC